MFYSQGENRRKRWYRMLSIGQKKLLVIGGIVAVALISLLAVFIVYTVRAADYDLAKVTQPVAGGMLYDANNEPVAALDSNVVVPVSYNDLPKHLIDAFLAREDEHFFDHSGVVYSSVLRSVLRNISTLSYDQGASTISMQLTRNVFDLQGKTLDRKVLEVFLTRRIERNFDKETILTQYLNRIYFGQGCYGIGSAARYYFGKKVKDLDLVECATLAGLVRGPSILNPVADMGSAESVRNETLDRMLAEGLISEEEHHNAVLAPIVLGAPEDRKVEDNSYPTMWVKKELDGLRGELKDSVDGASVVSTLCMPLQLQLEDSVEGALQAVEVPGHFPAAWEPFLGDAPEQVAAGKKDFMKVRRPKELKVRGADNDMKDTLQCCVLVVDMRRRSQGNVLAVVSGRSVVDGIDRWHGKVKPGRVAAPLVFCCACLPGSDDHHIVSKSAEVTGSRLGYDVVRSFMDSLGLDTELPPRERAEDLYNGMFPVSRIDLARVLFCLRNQGRGYKLSMVRSVWNRAGGFVHAWKPEKAPEYIRRESAVSVAGVSPFICEEGKPTVLSEKLPENNGWWTMICNDRGVAVFVWMGFDDPDLPVASMKEISTLLGKASVYLAREVHAYSRAYLKESMKKEKGASKK